MASGEERRSLVDSPAATPVSSRTGELRALIRDEMASEVPPATATPAPSRTEELRALIRDEIATALRGSSGPLAATSSPTGETHLKNVTVIGHGTQHKGGTQAAGWAQQTQAQASQAPPLAGYSLALKYGLSTYDLAGALNRLHRLHLVTNSGGAVSAWHNQAS